MSENKKAWLMLAPTMVVIGGLFIGGFIMGFMQSFDYMPITGNYDFSLDAYIAIFQSTTFKSAFWFTFYISIASTVLSIAVAIAVAMGIRKAFKGKRATMFAFQFPLTIPHLVSGIMILFLFSQSGLLARFCALLGLIETASEFPALIYSKNGIGIILAFMWKFVPYVGVAVVGILRTTGTEYEEAAISLGAGPWQRFTKVLLPVIMPSITTSAILIFAYSFGSYEIPFLLGATFPKTLSLLSYEAFTSISLADRPQSMAMSTIITVIVLVVVLIYRKFSDKIRLS